MKRFKGGKVSGIQMRVCFRSQVQPGVADEYRRRHAQVWPEMLRALKDAGWHNYSLFLADDGLLIGYLECEDFDQVRARMALTEVNARWQAEMSTLFADTEHPPDEGFTVLPEVFNLEDQFAGAASNEGRASSEGNALSHGSAGLGAP